MLVVAETAPPALAQARVEHLLAGVAEGRVAEVMAERDRLGEILVQPQRARHGSRDPGCLQRVCEPRAVVVALRVDEDLRLVLQPPEGLRVDDPVAVALKRRPQAALLLLLGDPPARLVGAHGDRREPGLLLLSYPRFERVRDPP